MLGFIEGLVLNTNFFFGGTYPTSGWQLGFGVVYVDTVDPKFNLGPEWFYQFTDNANPFDGATQSLAYSSFSMGTFPLRSLKDNWENIARVLFNRESVDWKMPYIAVSLKWEYPLKFTTTPPFFTNNYTLTV